MEILMISEFPLMLFTVLTGIAIGAYVGAALFPKKGSDEKAWIFPLVALILLACGGFAAMGHLGRPHMMMNVLHNPGSSITMEGICTGIVAVIAIIDMVLAKQKGEANRGVRIVGAIAGIIFMCIVTSVYVKSYGNPAWMSTPTYCMFLAGDLAAGFAAWKLFADAEGSHPIDAPQAIPATGKHSWDAGKVTKEPTAKAKGERKISEAVENALASPLLNRQDIKGAKNILFNLSYSDDCPLTLDEVDQTLKMIQAKASRNYGGNDANIIWGSGPADLEEGEIELTIIATGFDSHDSRIEPQPPTIDEIGLPKENFGEEVKAEEDKMPQAPAVETKWKIKERYKNIDTLLMQPAFFRMGVKLTGASAAVKSSAKVQVESTTEEAAGEQTSSPKAAEQSLF
jgi:hypothetical protein